MVSEVNASLADALFSAKGSGFNFLSSSVGDVRMVTLVPRSVGSLVLHWVV
jgi:hypothetical protein